jgi:5'-AMP-activated protein kinase catalytic alpha subunit
MVFGYLPFCDDDEETNINNIIDGNYEIPSSASPDLYDLLSHLLDINPITRYDLDQIKIHPWYNLITPDTNRPGLIIGYHKIPVDQRIINICKSYGYDGNKVRESVINNNYDNNSSIYYIILKKMKTMGIESISDLNSDEYLDYISDPSNIIFNSKYSKYSRYLKIIHILTGWHINGFALISGIVGYKSYGYANLFYCKCYIYSTFMDF